ncbi:hypothetical protein [Peribacillus butanolivorans]|uniref:hypothetical protein n=1 Tax=Peribacillus butanolivorans TaxID=421767 RepID=UPI00365B4DC1
MNQKTEKTKYNSQTGQVSLFDDDPSFIETEYTIEQSQQTTINTVLRNIEKKKRNNLLRGNVEVKAIQHHQDNT